MFEFFDKILGFFETLFSFFFSLIETIVVSLGMLLQMVDVPFTFSPLLPSLLYTSMSIVISVGVIKFLLGR